ncbi:hypothetical protein [Arthrobacter sp. MMS18-M83]|uniref:hypothetical protein n=1 Tax=Arthrobacter sp. MMS18-M83 TaxID=2996261 RepID=UPI002279FBF5|nr:hypothetical protein [Arthrobacter sp. MMS18-M83]WAH95241.1 hypothetical protein OW521_12270 [Arthrobacter sp. MMS18-M83]
MKLRGLLLIELAVLAIVLALAVFIRGGVSTICPAVGYPYTGDVELVFAHEPTWVAACFGEGCTPAKVTRHPDGRWLHEAAS